MEQPKFPGEERECERGLELGATVKMVVQNQLLEYLIASLGEDGVKEMYMAAGMQPDDNVPAMFCINGISDRYRNWYESLCDGVDPVDMERQNSRMSAQNFQKEYGGKPREVLAAVLSYVDGLGYKDVDEYLRELREWFKVNPAGETQEVPRNSILMVSIKSRLTRQAVDGLMQEAQSKSA